MIMLNISKPKFSIICPVYNCEKFFEEEIKSVINQSFRDWELIIIDDGSTDNSPIIGQKYSRLDKRIRYLSQKNSGQFKARLNGIEHAQGDYILFLDSDDAFIADALIIIDNLIGNNAYDCVFFNAKILVRSRETLLLSQEDFTRINNDLIYETVIKGTTGWSCCKAIKSSLLNLEILRNISDQSFKFSHNEDLILMCTCLDNVRETAFSNTAVYLYYKDRSTASYFKPSKDYLNSLVFSLNYRVSLLEKYNLNREEFLEQNKNVAFYHLYSILSNKLITNREKKEAILYLLNDSLYNELYVKWCKTKKPFKAKVKKIKFEIWRYFYGK